MNLIIYIEMYSPGSFGLLTTNVVYLCITVLYATSNCCIININNHCTAPYILFIFTYCQDLNIYWFNLPILASSLNELNVKFISLPMKDWWIQEEKQFLLFVSNYCKRHLVKKISCLNFVCNCEIFLE